MHPGVPDVAAAPLSSVLRPPSFWGEAWPRGVAGVGTDVFEDDSNYFIRAYLPGADPNAINLSAQDNVLTISGETTAETPEGWRPVVQELGYRRFERHLSRHSAGRRHRWQRFIPLPLSPLPCDPKSNQLLPSALDSPPVAAPAALLRGPLPPPCEKDLADCETAPYTVPFSSHWTRAAPAPAYERAPYTVPVSSDLTPAGAARPLSHSIRLTLPAPPRLPTVPTLGGVQIEWDLAHALLHVRSVAAAESVLWMRRETFATQVEAERYAGAVVDGGDGAEAQGGAAVEAASPSSRHIPATVPRSREAVPFAPERIAARPTPL